MDYNLCDYKSLVRLLTPYGFNFSKALGQNFIIDSSVCPTMVEMLGTDKNTGVLEIGPGVGVLTKELCKASGKVVSVELDERLYPVLDKTLEDYDNFELVKGDCMKLNLKEIIEEKLAGFDTIKVCANLPYYITSPVIMSLLESKLPITEIEVMVQQEAAERLCAEIGSREAGAVSVAVSYYGEAQILFNVGRECFMPSPKVDSSVIKIRLYDEPKYVVKNEKRFFSLIKGIFAQRRKTLVNSLSNSVGLPKTEIQNSLSQMGLAPTVRAENLTMEELVELSELLIK
ncbi:16S rRNA (adenine(1518)-N(6)/adenine(1519)-N(6))-dimethyltransferase RsmA [uncultured Eubacterium sp.]|uniref:16S rRNA (adenine(1518)-N(6)/adenine(1519)-N(6))- dimethyltransferase RsmA n=1 Tax=uncultured Eubacterium sp. TaxID=165185 RepID=UPI0028048B05|nr:16S rRNA (adenine(1518)-N(6)/adenine(1519)-N(6))-dimethyltransferase RsmA [uncultured Eubacterium sp.]